MKVYVTPEVWEEPLVSKGKQNMKYEIWKNNLKTWKLFLVHCLA